MKVFDFKPRLFSALKNYSKETFMADLMAGIIVGIVALPRHYLWHHPAIRRSRIDCSYPDGRHTPYLIGSF